MVLSYEVTDDYKVIVKSDTKKIDVVGAFESEESAHYWGTNVCNKYNSPEYAGIYYPNDLLKEDN